MCGRFTLSMDGSTLIDLLAIEHFKSDFYWCPSYNIAPTHFSPVITSNGYRNIQSMRWGFIPHWATNRRNGINMIKTRSESIIEKPAFRNLIKSQRCIVLADGYYEWMMKGTTKQPFYIHLPKKQILPLAGLWDQWIDHKQKEWLSYTIITTESSIQLNHIHNRMPVIKNYDDIDEWIDTQSKTIRALELLKPYPDELVFYPVSTFVNSYNNNALKCITPVTLKDQ